MYLEGNKPGFTQLKVEITWTNGEAIIDYITATQKTLKLVGESEVLTKSNTSSFTPTSNYHPATKKYVDEMIAALRTELSS